MREKLRRILPILVIALFITPLATAYNAKALSLDDISEDIWNAIKQAASDVWNSIKQGLGDALGTFKDYLLAPFKAAVDIISGFVSAVKLQFFTILGQYKWITVALALVITIAVGVKLIGRSIF